MQAPCADRISWSTPWFEPLPHPSSICPRPATTPRPATDPCLLPDTMVLKLQNVVYLHHRCSLLHCLEGLMAARWMTFGLLSLVLGAVACIDERTDPGPGPPVDLSLLDPPSKGLG